MGKWVIALCAIVLVGGGVFWNLTRPADFDSDVYTTAVGDPDAGALVFAAAGCGSCHSDKSDDPDAPPLLSGGYRIESPFGTFIAPNISPGPNGLEGWSLPDFARALTTGVSPRGQHYYPSFPYSAYQHMKDQDVTDLWAYLQSLPVSDADSQPHELPFPFTIRRGLGLWKAVLPRNYVLQNANTAELERGRYLVEALGHCAECHTPRDASGHLDRSRWMQGAPNPSGKGRIPPIDPANLTWSTVDIAYYLESGFTPDYDSVGGTMASVVTNTAKLSAEDRAAIATYLKALP